MRLAIIGMDVYFEGCEDLATFERCVYQGAQVGKTILQGQASSKNYRTEVELLGKVVQGGIADACILTDERQLKIAVLIAVNTTTASIMNRVDLAHKIGQSTGIDGLTIDLSDEPDPWNACIEKAGELLESKKAGAVVIASAALHDRLDDPLVEQNNRATGLPCSMGLATSTHGWMRGEGAASIVVTGDNMVSGEGSGRRKANRVYAWIETSVFESWTADSQGSSRAQTSVDVTAEGLEDAVMRCSQSSFRIANIAPADIGYLDVFGCGYDPLDRAEIIGLNQAYRNKSSTLTCAIGSAQSNTGYLSIASGLVGVIKAAIAIYHRFIPAVPGWPGPKLPDLWRGSPFYVPLEARPWFTEGIQDHRVAAVNIVNINGTCDQVILSEAAHGSVSDYRLRLAYMHLYPIAGNSADELVANLSKLKADVRSCDDLSTCAERYYSQYQAKGEDQFAVVVLGNDAADLTREIEFALRGIPSAFEKGTEWQTPSGSYFTPAPLGKQNKIAFVYPGAFNSYPGFGSDLFHLFPEFYDRLASLVVDVGAAVQEKLLYPRFLEAPSKEMIELFENRLNTDAVAMLTSGMCMAILFTLILNETFKINNQSAFGYSLGENSMMFATGVMTHGYEGKKRLDESPLFKTRLAGPQNAVREFWGMSPSNEIQAESDFWVNYVLMAPPEQVMEVIEGDDRVFLTHINTPRQVAIAGDKKSVLRVIETLHCNALRAPFNYVLHCEAMQSEYPALVEMHRWPVDHKPTVSLYSSADCDTFEIESESIARKMARGLCQTVDFPRLVNKVYDDGARLFVELGAGSNCTKWIDDTLKTKPHCAMSINRRGVSDLTSILRVLARLCSQRVPLDLSPLFKAS